MLRSRDKVFIGIPFSFVSSFSLSPPSVLSSFCLLVHCPRYPVDQCYSYFLNSINEKLFGFSCFGCTLGSEPNLFLDFQSLMVRLPIPGRPSSQLAEVALVSDLKDSHPPGDHCWWQLRFFSWFLDLSSVKSTETDLAKNGPWVIVIPCFASHPMPFLFILDQRLQMGQQRYPPMLFCVFPLRPHLLLSSPLPHPHFLPSSSSLWSPVIWSLPSSSPFLSILKIQLHLSTSHLWLLKAFEFVTPNLAPKFSLHLLYWPPSHLSPTVTCGIAMPETPLSNLICPVLTLWCLAFYTLLGINFILNFKLIKYNFLNFF